IGETLRSRGLEVTVLPASEVRDPAPFDAAVLGSAVYAGHWMKEAKELADRLVADGPREVWLFSSGPVGDPPKPEEDPVDVAAVVEATRAREHRVFAGKIDKRKLGFGERAIVAALRAPEGDFRQWDQINEWAEAIAVAMRHQVEAG